MWNTERISDKTHSIYWNKIFLYMGLENILFTGMCVHVSAQKFYRLVQCMSGLDRHITTIQLQVSTLCVNWEELTNQKSPLSCQESNWPQNKFKL